MTTPDLTTYRVIHRALRTGAHNLAAAAAASAGDGRRNPAMEKYWKGYVGELRAHHLVEDAVFFPALVERVPVATGLTERTAPEHREVEELLVAIDAAMATVVVGGGGGVAEVAELLARLDSHLDDHLSFEDADVLPLFERHFSASEYEVLDKKALDAVGVGKQAMFTVPFALTAATATELPMILGSAPLPLRILWRATRRGHERMCTEAFGSVASVPTGA